MAGLSKTHVALAFEGAPIVHADMAALQVLRQIIGGDKAVKWGVGASKYVLGRDTFGIVAGARTGRRHRLQCHQAWSMMIPSVRPRS